MEDAGGSEAVLLALAQRLDFSRRYYGIVAATAGTKPCLTLPEAEIADLLKSTGRAFRFNRKERFYSTRENVASGELGLHVQINGSVEFILVASGPAGHFGPTFHGLALELAERHAPELVPSPRYPRPDYGSAAELRRVLADGLELYAALATEIRASGLLGSA